VGVVGGGFGLSFFWHEHPNSEVVAVAELREDRRKLLMKQNPKAEAYVDFKDLVKDKNVEAVAVFTGVPEHAWMAEHAMKNGKHVVCAVPAAISLEECERLIEASKSTGMKYMNAESSYYYPGIIACRKWKEEGKFGEIFYSEGEYNHDVEDLRGEQRWFFYEGKPTWRLGLPPMFYITHSSAGVISVTGERLTEVACLGWGHDHQALKKNPYGNNPFSNSVALFKTSNGHAARITEFRHCAPAGMVRNAFYGTEMSYFDGLGPGKALSSKPPEVVTELEEQSYWDMLPPELRRPSGHSGSHTHLTHEFISSIVEDRWPAINVYEAVAFCAPGITAHVSEREQGVWKKIPDFGRAPGSKPA
jgi:predicted dehydrogenase